ncbi:sensor histidine kinase [Spongiactinospora rosea]|nr:histidine kinase [Spongiactinospora rosea]
MGRECFGAAALGALLAVGASLVLRAIGRGGGRAAEQAGADADTDADTNADTNADIDAAVRIDAGAGPVAGAVAAEVLRERRRIARELHDTVGHGLLMIAMQARRLPPLAPQARPVAESIDDMVRVVLADMRRTVGVLRGDRAQAAPDRADPLSAQVATVVSQVPHDEPGGPVELAISGAERRLPEPVEAIALRVVREGLTNALKHGDGSTVRVRLGFGGDRLSVSVRNGCGRPAGYVPRAAGGHGLAGLRESVITEGGGFVCGPLTSGGFVVQAWLPAEEQALRQARGHARRSTETGEAHEMCPSAHCR